MLVLLISNTEPRNVNADNPPPEATLPQSPAPAAAAPFERRAVLSAAVDLASPQQILEHLIECAANRTGCSVVGISAPYATAMAKDAALRDAFLKADVLIPDGKGFVWGARALGVPCGERIAIPDLCERLLEEGSACGWKIFIYGATADLNAAAIANVKTRFPNLAAVEGQHGYDQGDAEEQALIAKLRDEKFNVLIVARPSPDKEKFLAHCCHTAGVVGLAAGGYADILAGAKKRAPQFVQLVGMEWFYRLMQDPAKLWKRIGWANMKFAAAVAWNAFLGVPRRAWFAQPVLHVVALVAIVLLAYGKSLDAPYHFDDPEYILRNTAIRSFSTLNQITITKDRKIWWFSNAVSYYLAQRFGAKNPTHPDVPDVRFFRGWNIACHLIAALALYGLLRRCLKASKNAGSGADEPDMRPVAAAAIFAAHPLCTESVTYISGRDNGMGGMFYLLGMYCAAIAFQRMGFLAPAYRAKEYWPKWFWPSFLALFFGACALLTKESHITYPVAVALVYFCFFRRGPSPKLSLGLLGGMVLALIALGWGAAGRYEGCLWISSQLALGVLIVGGLLGGACSPRDSLTPRAIQPLVGPLPGGEGKAARAGIRTFFQKRVGTGWAFLCVAVGLGVAAVLAYPYAYSRVFEALTGHQGSSYVRSLCSQANALPAMLLRTILPLTVTTVPDFNIAHNLNIDHQFATISDPFDPRALAGGAILLGLIAFGIFGAFRGWLGAFGVLLAFIAIAPTNTVIERGDIVSERNFYLAAAGGACVIAWLACGLAQAIARRIEAASDTAAAPGSSSGLQREAGLWTLIFACCFAGPFVAFTKLRNNDWGDPYRLWKNAMEHSPDKMRVLYNFGISAQSVNKIAEAEAAYNRAVAIGEDMSKRGAFRPDEAVDVKCFHLAYARLAEIHLTRYIRSNKEDYKTLNTIKKIYDDGLNRTAWDPDLAMTYAEFLIKIGQAAEAAPMLRQSFYLHSWADELYLPLGIAHLEAGDFPEAARWLELSLHMRADHSLGYSNDMPADYRAQILAFLGVARSRLKLKDEAKAAYREALSLQPESLLPILTGYNATHNLMLTPEQTSDQMLNALSQIRRDILVGLRDAANELLAAPSPTLPENVIEFKKLFDYEINRRDGYQKKRVEMGFKDDPDKDQ